MRFSKRVSKLPRYPKAERDVKELARLSSNENPFGFSPRVRDAVIKSLDRVNRYPDGDFRRSREIVAERFSLSPDMVIFGNGLDEIIELFCKVFLDEGEKVVLTEPCFPLYETFSLIYGGSIKKVPLKGFSVDVEGMLREMKGARLVFLNSPMNPTGVALKRDELSAIVEGLGEDTVVFIDEAYVEFMDSPPDTVSFLREGYPIVVGRTLSKAYGLAGMRIGYALADREVVACMESARQPYSLGVLEEAAAEAALSDEEFLKWSVSAIKKERKRLEKALAELGFEFVKSQANFLLVRFGKDVKELYDFLKTRGIFVRRMDAYGFPEYVRVSVGRPEENDLFIEALRSWREI